VQAALTILTATSGDTGSAVANAFHKIAGIRVIVLFPIGEVSDRQRRQMTTLRENIRTIAVDGKFDDCSAGEARLCRSNLKHIALSSANSINIAVCFPERLLLLRRLARGQSGGAARLAVPVGTSAT